ncbi:MAG: acyl-ACP--UDP-N-acetylglucosamine O-acyltransferase [Gemmatimonadetes bacterium]|nr:acyl-ACP--UDP-N-acetylglucosamine O-acyltransferase [Gemmatimonadota bacterium]
MPLSRVHATALVDPRAHLAEDVVVGPYCIVGPDVELGPGCELASHVRIDGPLVAGANNRFYHGAAIGGVPQDLKYSGARSRVEIGDHNVFREYVTVNRATEEGHATRIGSHCLLMAYVHVAHDCVLHDHVILANSVNLAGHVEIEERAIIGGMTPVHQFVRIGRYSIVGGGSRGSQDMPPFFKAAGNPLRVVGLNTVGLERNGVSVEARRALKEAYRHLYRSKLNVSQAVERIRSEHGECEEIQHLLRFIEASDRGIVR